MVLTDLVSAEQVLQHDVAVAKCGYLFFCIPRCGLTLQSCRDCHFETASVKRLHRVKLHIQHGDALTAA